MKKSILLISLLSLGILITLQNCNNSATNYSAAGSSACVAPASWFPHSQTPAPEEGNNSPFANPKTTVNCDFHQWAFQKFLYLTKIDANGLANFENLIQVDNQMNPLGKQLILQDITQAGTHSVLHDFKGQPIYYAIHTNQQMFDFTNQFVNKFIESSRSNSSTNPIDPGKLDSLGLNKVTYPVGAFEIKTSWILVTSLPPGDTSNYYITNAYTSISQNVPKGKNNTGNAKPSRVALLGMHIVGRVANHPENIWATFEHTQLAPTAVWPPNFQTDSIPDSTQILSTNDYLFYKRGTPLYQCSIRDSVGYPYLKQSTYHLFDHGSQPNYLGNLPAEQKQDSVNLVNIKSLNKSVRDSLGKYNDKGPWSNYEYIGSVWIDPTVDTLVPGDAGIGALARPNLRGSRANTNVTMETYAQLNWDFANSSQNQTGQSTPNNSMNCFGCHTTINFNINNGLGYNLALSHLFNNRLGQFLKGEMEQKAVHSKK